MLAAIRQHYLKSQPNSRLMVLASSSSFVELRKRYRDLDVVLGLERAGLRCLNQVPSYLPKMIRRAMRLSTEHEADIILDSSGFAYSDDLDPRRLAEMSAKAKKWRHDGKKLVLLPQAFGPFRNQSSIEALKAIVDNAHVIFARDKISFGYLRDHITSRESIRLAPDFTNLVDGGSRKEHAFLKDRICIVPNYHVHNEKYLRYFNASIRAANDLGKSAFLLVHCGKRDREIARQLSKECSPPLPVIEEPDPIYLKGIIGSSYALLGSRFHALVSALSQAVPVVATSWSHKYECLLEDYACPECIMPLNLSEKQQFQRLSHLLSSGANTAFRFVLQRASTNQKAASSEMWSIVDEICKT
jgi:colanic acid/amylovoran biosynthesis protein